jgi:alkylation response protein AidB-like acyl-CoA dehydrogenase
MSGRPINDPQGIQFKLADMEAGTAAARELLYKACSMADRAKRPADLGKWTSMAKLIASDNAMKVTVEAIQVLGGYGYVNEYPVERMMRDAKITQIYEGTNEIQLVDAQDASGTRAARSSERSMPPAPAARLLAGLLST